MWVCALFFATCISLRCFYLQLCGEHSTSHSDLHLYLVSQIRRISLISSLAAGSRKAEWRPENKRRCQSTSPASSQPFRRIFPIVFRIVCHEKYFVSRSAPSRTIRTVAGLNVEWARTGRSKLYSAPERPRTPSLVECGNSPSCSSQEARLP